MNRHINELIVSSGAQFCIANTFHLPLWCWSVIEYLLKAIREGVALLYNLSTHTVQPCWKIKRDMFDLVSTYELTPVKWSKHYSLKRQINEKGGVDLTLPFNIPLMLSITCSVWLFVLLNPASRRFWLMIVFLFSCQWVLPIAFWWTTIIFSAPWVPTLITPTFPFSDLLRSVYIGWWGLRCAFAVLSVPVSYS